MAAQKMVSILVLCLAVVATLSTADNKVDLLNIANGIRDVADEQVRVFKDSNKNVSETFQSVVNQIDTITQNLNSVEFTQLTKDIETLIRDELKSVQGVTGALLDQYSDRAAKQEALTNQAKQLFEKAEKYVVQYKKDNNLLEMYQFDMCLHRVVAVSNCLYRFDVNQIGKVKPMHELKLVDMELQAIDKQLKQLIH